MEAAEAAHVAAVVDQVVEAVAKAATHLSKDKQVLPTMVAVVVA